VLAPFLLLFLEVTFFLRTAMLQLVLAEKSGGSLAHYRQIFRSILEYHTLLEPKEAMAG
jgi:hypothetical protein